MTRANGIQAHVMAQFTKHPGSVIYLNDMAAESKFDARQLQNSVRQIINRNILPGIEIVSRGNSWRYMPNKKVEADPKETGLLEKLGSTKSGKILVRDEDGTIYTLGEEL